MSGIYVQKLNPKLKQNIADKVYTISEMAQIRKKVETQIATTQKGVRRAAITLLVIAVVLLCMTAAQIGTGMIFRPGRPVSESSCWPQYGLPALV